MFLYLLKYKQKYKQNACLVQMFNKCEKQRMRGRKEIRLEPQEATKMIKFNHTWQRKQDNKKLNESKPYN